MLPKLNKLTTLWVSLIVTALGVATYCIGLKTPFENDDINQIINNPVVHSITHIKLFFEGGTFYNDRGLTPLSGTYYRPLMTTTFSLLYTVFGAHSFYFHLLQLLLCIGSTILLYLFFRYSFTPLLSLTLSLVFLVHPLDSQVVYAIPSMQDALFFFFGILAMWLLVRLSSTRSLFLVAICLFLSLLSKETAICFVAMALLYLFWWNRKRFFPFMGIMVFPTVLWLVLRIHAIGVNANPGTAPIDNLSLIGRLMTAPSIMQFYLVKLVFPWKLATAYYWIYPHFSVNHVLIPLLIDLATVALIIYMAFVIRPRVSKAQHLTYIFFAVWAGLGLLTTLQIIPIDMTACEIWFYFSMAGALGMVGVVLVAFQAYIRPRWFLVGAILVIGVLGVRTVVRGVNYSSEYTLAMHDISVSSKDYTADNDVSSALLQRGKYTQAKWYAERSVHIYPSFTNFNDLGVALEGLGNYPAAARAFYDGLKYGQYSLLYDNIGELTLVYGNPNVDKQYLLQSLQSFPQDSSLWMYLAILDARHDNNTEAKVAIANAARYGQVPQFIYSSIMNDQPFTINFTNIVKSIKVQ